MRFLSVLREIIKKTFDDTEAFLNIDKYIVKRLHKQRRAAAQKLCFNSTTGSGCASLVSCSLALPPKEVQLKLIYHSHFTRF